MPSAVESGRSRATRPSTAESARSSSRSRSCSSLCAHFLVPGEFGRLELVLATVALVDVLITAGMDGVFARFYFDRDDPQWRRQGDHALPGDRVGLPGSDRLPARHPLRAALRPGVRSRDLCGLLRDHLVDIYLTNIVDLPMNLTRLRRERRRFAAYSLTRGLTQIVAERPSRRRLAARREGDSHCLPVGCLCRVRDHAGSTFTTSPVMSTGASREMISFAWPGIIGGLAFYGLNLLDRSS